MLELIKGRSQVQEKNMFTNLPRIIVTCNFSSSSFELKTAALPLLTK